MNEKLSADGSELVVKLDRAAFPCVVSGNGKTFIGHGLTKREYFAAQALAGMMANTMWNAASPAQIAIAAFDQADAVLKHGSE